MPLLRLWTNRELDASGGAKALCLALSSQTAEILGKPESYVQVIVHGDTPMLFGGSDAPTAFFEVYSLGSISGEQAERFSAQISALLSETLDVPAARVYSNFHGWPARELWGTNGGTFG